MTQEQKQNVLLEVCKYQLDGVDREVEYDGINLQLSQISEMIGEISLENL
jgi:hypothetical protein